jgi:hypothetical protein
MLRNPICYIEMLIAHLVLRVLRKARATVLEPPFQTVDRILALAVGGFNPRNP